MPINFPTALDILTNPIATDGLDSPPHATQHADVNDAIEALEAKVGIDSSAVTTSHDYKLSEVTSTDKAVGKTATQTLTNKTFVAPALGTPASGVMTNVTGTASGLTAGLATDTVSKTGTGSTYVTNTSPTLVTPALGTPASGVMTNVTGTAANLTAGTATVANGLKSATTTVSVSGATAPLSGQVLTATSSTAATWQEIGGGGITTIASGSLNTGTSLEITNIPATYAYLVLRLANLSNDTGADEFLVQVSTNNGSSYDTTAANYEGIGINGTTITEYTKASLTKGGVSSAGGGGNGTNISIFNYHAGTYPNVFGRTVFEDTNNVINQMTYIGSTAAIDAIKILWDGAANFDGSGTYALYGVK